MSIFWFLAGMLSTLAALTVILPWLRTVPHLESLPALPWQAPLIGVLMVVGSLSMYRWLGHPELATTPGIAMQHESSMILPATRATADAEKMPAGSMNAAIDSLRARLVKGGNSADDWELLAKSYEFVDRPDDARLARAHQLPPAPQNMGPAPEPAPKPGSAPSEAVAAAPLSPESRKLLTSALQARRDKHYAVAAKLYQQLAAAHQMNADAWADFADTAGTLQGGKLAGEPDSYVSNALSLEPDHAKALWLRASADEEAGRFADANRVWRHLQALLPPDSADAQIITANLLRDQQVETGSAVPPTAAVGAHISGEVSISGSLSMKATPGFTLFIVAKSVDSPGPPVAVYRGSVSGWPVKFTLDDSSSMLPGRNLTNSKRITVEARVSRSGQALPAVGDLRGATGVIDPAHHEPVKILIDEIVS